MSQLFQRDLILDVSVSNVEKSAIAVGVKRVENLRIETTSIIKLFVHKYNNLFKNNRSRLTRRKGCLCYMKV